MRTMLAIIGDCGFNRRLLRVAVRACGIDRVLEAGRTDDLLQLCDNETPDLILVDPAIDPESPRELVAVLLDRYPRAAVVVISPHLALVAWAHSIGVAGACKRSVLSLDRIQEAIREGLRRKDESEVVIDARTPREVLDARVIAARDFDETSAA